MSELVPSHGELDMPAHGPGRALGQRRKPQLRLALGYQDEQRGGAPIKTDHFLARGDDRAITKFVSVYGDRPRAVDIRLPGTLGGFLDIRHVAFASGYLRAIGTHNFALRGALGGHDILTVFSKDDQGAGLVVEERAISGVHDPYAQSLQVFLRMQVSFGIPDVLGFGGLCQVTTRGKESMDTLWLTAVDIYGQLGSYAMVALRPKLVLKPSTMLTPLGSRAPLYVLDLWVPESLDEVYARLQRHHELVPAQGAAAAALLYGETTGEEPSAERSLLTPSVLSGAGLDNPPTPAEGIAPSSTGATPEGGHRSLSDESASSPVGPLHVGGSELAGPGAYEIPADVKFDPSPDDPGAAVVPATSRKYGGQRLVDVARTQDGRGWLKWASAHWETPPEFVAAVRAFVEGLP